MQDITTSVEEFINSGIIRNKNIYDKLFNAIQFIRLNNIHIYFMINKFNDLSIELLKDDDEIGRFEISKLGDKNSMGIYIDDNYTGKELARLLVASVIYALKKYAKISKYTLFKIDTDASVGFWDNIGMVDNREYARRGYGYEKDISLRDITLWCLGNTDVFNDYGGYKKRKTQKHKRKNNKYNITKKYRINKKYKKKL